MNGKTVISGHKPSPRQGEILDAALRVFIIAGNSFTMDHVAQEALCSKETLYNWFGNREGLLRATISWQAAKVREPKIDLKQIDVASFENALENFATDLLSVLLSETSVALNRAAISSVNSKQSELGKLLLENGRFAMGRRIKPLLKAARKKSLINFKSDEETFRILFGLIVRDVQLRLLLGERLKYSKAKINKEAKLAVQAFLILHQN